MKNVVLFSPNGYVGSFIKKVLLLEEGIRLYEITRNSDLEQYTDSYDVLIYSAAITSARGENAKKYVQDNVLTAFTMADFCKEHGIKRVIYLSSDEIYGELNTGIVSQRAVMVNPNIYAVTKYLAENIMIASEIPCYILRLPSVVGRVWGRTFIYNLMLRIKNNEHISLYNIEKEFNNIVDIDDLTRFIIILCYCEKNDRGEVFLLGNTKKVKLRDIVFHVKELYNSTSEIDSIETCEKRYFTLDTSKAEEYGYSSKSIMTIIDDLYHLSEGYQFEK